LISRDLRREREREGEAIGSWGLQWDWVVDFKGLLLGVVWW
jgi:hypothetical protein